jgi:release factor glutamine methyltransferase
LSGWPTIGALLRDAPIDLREARILLCHALGMSRVELITQAERAVDSEQAGRVADLFRRRHEGEPVAYLVGEREFYGLPFFVDPAVLIPRPETELLVELALQRAPRNGRLVDLGTGSGAIAVALAHARPDLAVSAVDVSAPALAVARRNAERNAAAVEFLQGDWYAPLGARKFDLIVSNPPYVAAGDPHLAQGDLRFEPALALTEHGDGLSALRTIAGGAAAHLAPGGWLLMEHGYDQALAVRALLAAQGFSSIESWRDLAGIERVSGGRL